MYRIFSKEGKYFDDKLGWLLREIILSQVLTRESLRADQQGPLINLQPEIKQQV